MAGMKRFVTYIYAYEDRKKGNNVGFARVDIRGEECRVEIHLRGIYPGRSACRIFLIKEEEAGLVGVPIGELKLANGNGDFGAVVKSGKIGESPFGIQEMEGVFLLGEDERIFMSRWQEGTVSEIDPSCFREWKQDDQTQAAGIQKTDDQAQEAGIQKTDDQTQAAGIQKKVIQTKTAGPRSSGAQLKRNDIQNSKMQTNTGDMRSDAPGDRSGRIDFSRDENENLTATELPMHNIFPEYNWLSVWETLQKTHPVSTPFENPNVICVRIELKDLRELPKRYWYLGNNSFLLHGFFNYQHLIIGKSEEERWFIGIPGIYQRQERVMAAIFGFSEFVPAAVEEPGADTGEPINRYGYWYRYMEE